MAGNPMQPTAVSNFSAEATAASGSGSGGSSGGGTTSGGTTTTSPLVISTTSMPAGNVGSSYAAFITSSGGQGTPHQFALVGGQLPPGLTMATSYGVQSTSVTGKPSATGTWSFTVQVRDQTGHTATRTFSLSVTTPKPLVITNQSDTLAPGTVGTSYALNLFANGGTQPYRWAITGQLPPGIGLSGNQLRGTPTTPGTFSFTATVSDAKGQSASRTFSITVSR